MRTKILTILFIGIFIGSGCIGAGTSVTGHITPVPVPEIYNNGGEETSAPPQVKTVAVEIEPQAIPTPPLSETPTPKLYEKYEVEGEIIEAWQFKDPKDTISAMAPVVITLAAADGILPIGDVIALVIISGSAYYLIAQSNVDVGVLNPNLPHIPETDWPGIEHAASHRAWPIMFTMIVYSFASHSPDGVFYGPSSGRILVIKQISAGTVGLIFGSQPNLLPDPSHLPIADNLITVVINAKGRVDQIRMSDCASWQLAPALGYNPIFEPPPVGSGTCLKNGNFSKN